MNFKGLVFLAIVAALAVSCSKKDDQQDELDLYPARDMALIQGAYSDAFSMVDKVGKSEPGLRDNYGLPECATVIFQDTLQFPYTLMIDFGETNCEDEYGILRRGKIHITITGPYQDVGTSITTWLDNYFVMNHQLQGERVVTNLGQNEMENLHFSVEESNVSLTAPNNEWVSYWESNRDREWVSGRNTMWNPFDDEYSITGAASGVTRLGTPYTIEITQPLIVKVWCPYIVSGGLDVLPENSSVLQVDYGAGGCDQMATVTVNGNEYDITLQ